MFFLRRHSVKYDFFFFVVNFNLNDLKMNTLTFWTLSLSEIITRNKFNKQTLEINCFSGKCFSVVIVKIDINGIRFHPLPSISFNTCVDLFIFCC